MLALWLMVDIVIALPLAGQNVVARADVVEGGVLPVEVREVLQTAFRRTGSGTV
jgi:hypothetical protein